MKRLIQIEYEFEEGDMDLLREGLPENPCEGCGMTISCRGCEKSEKYRLAVITLQEHDLLEVAENINELKKLRKQKDEIMEKIVELTHKIPHQVFQADLV